jgi:hypothetical protein
MSESFDFLMSIGEDIDARWPLAIILVISLAAYWIFDPRRPL